MSTAQIRLRATLWAWAWVVVLALLTGVVSAQTGNPGPDIWVNNLTGSDTAASGAPSTLAPVSAVATCHTGGALSTTIQWVANGLSGAGVPTDGTAAIWLATASGRRWSAIVGLGTDTVTVLDNFNIPAGTPVDCAVGGKRASINQRVVTDLLGNNNIITYGGNGGWWTLSLEETGTDYTTAVTLSTTGNLNCVIQGIKSGSGVSAVYPIHRLTVAATTMWQINDCRITGIHLLTDGATGQSGRAIITDGEAVVQDMVIGHVTDTNQSFAVAVEMRGAAVSDGMLVSSTIRNNTTGVEQECGGCMIAGNYFVGNGTGLIINNFNSAGNEAFYFPLIIKNIFANNGSALFSSQDMGAFIINNTIDQNTIGFVCLSDASCNFHQIWGNNFTSNTIGAQADCSTGPGPGPCALWRDISCGYNNFFGNTIARNGQFPTCPGDVAINPSYANGTLGANYNPTPTADVFCGPPAPGSPIPGSLTESPALECGAVQTNQLPVAGAVNVAF